MKIYDTSKKKYVPTSFKDKVQIYVCGITPYDSAHLGHIFTFMTYDLLARRLIDSGYEVQMVRNITDVDEPLYKKAKELGIDYMTLADRETASLNTVLKKMDFLPLFAQPRASEYIDEMAEAVAKLINSGHAYKLYQDTYFDISTYGEFSSFSGFNEKLLNNLFANRGGDPNRDGKRNKLDFLLWKNISNPDDPAQWSTVVGNGRPGWHIECSVMSTILLGETFDIHGGGTDLIFPHHECEIAQSMALYGKQPADIWMHTSPMLMAGEKMSKSLGNMVFIKDLLEEYESNLIRLALMHYHHRMGGEWQVDLLNSAQKLLDKVVIASSHTTIDNAELLLSNLRTALDDDINTLEVINALIIFTNNKNIKGPSSSGSKNVVVKALDLIGIKV